MARRVTLRWGMVLKVLPFTPSHTGVNVWQGGNEQAWMNRSSKNSCTTYKMKIVRILGYSTHIIQYQHLRLICLSLYMIDMVGICLWKLGGFATYSWHFVCCFHLSIGPIASRPGEDHATKAFGNSQVGPNNNRPFGGNPPRKMVGAWKGGFLQNQNARIIQV